MKIAGERRVEGSYEKGESVTNLLSSHSTKNIIRRARARNRKIIMKVRDLGV